MHKNIICFLICCGCFLGKAQDSESFSKIYSKTIIETSEKDFDKALKIADSLYQASTSPLFQLKSLMLSASLYQKSGDYQSAIDYAEKAKIISEETGDYNWQTRIYGFLATHYRILKLYSKSQEYLKASIAIANKIQSSDQANSVLGFIYQEMAYSDNAMKKYKSAIRNVQKSNSCFFKAGNIPNKEYLLANNDQLLGENYYYLDNYPLSEKYYLKAEKVLKSSPGFLLGLVYDGLAKIKMKQDDLKEAEHYITKSKEIAEQSSHTALKEEIYKTSAEFYAKMNKPQEFQEAVQKYESANKTLDKSGTDVINKEFVDLAKQQQQTNKISNNKSMVIAVFIILLFLILFFWIIYYKQQKKQFERFKKILSGLKQQETIVPTSELLKNQDLHISEDTLKKLLENLKNFEKSSGFINKNMSLPFLAAELRTNTKYLSQIIKYYKKKDFTNYINDLRIEYIIKKLQTEPAYRRYKISILAKEAGFSSHSKFATIFKTRTGLSPSLFIGYLKKERMIV